MCTFDIFIVFKVFTYSIDIFIIIISQRSHLWQPWMPPENLKWHHQWWLSKVATSVRRPAQPCEDGEGRKSISIAHFPSLQGPWLHRWCCLNFLAVECKAMMRISKMLKVQFVGDNNVISQTVREGGTEWMYCWRLLHLELVYSLRFYCMLGFLQIITFQCSSFSLGLPIFFSLEECSASSHS